MAIISRSVSSSMLVFMFIVWSSTKEQSLGQEGKYSTFLFFFNLQRLYYAVIIRPDISAPLPVYLKKMTESDIRAS